VLVVVRCDRRSGEATVIRAQSCGPPAT
jgi:hypothetical protein